MKFKHIAFSKDHVQRQVSLENEQLAIAQEGLVDYIKEKFPTTVTAKDIEDLDGALARLTTSTHGNSEARQSFTLTNQNVYLLFKGGRMINDLPRELRRDASELTTVVGFLQKFNASLAKVKADAAKGESNKAFEGISKSELTSINGIDLLGNIQIKFNRRGAGRPEQKGEERLPEQPNPLWYLLWLLVPGLGIVIGVAHFATNHLKYKSQIEKMNASGSFVRKDFSEAATVLVKTLTSLRDGVEDFQKHAERLNDVNDKQVKDLLKFGTNLCQTIIHVVKNYDKMFKGI